MTNVYFRDAIQDAKESVAMARAFRPARAREAVSAARLAHAEDRRGVRNIEAMLDKLADYYDEEWEIATQSLMAALEPAIIIFLAVISHHYHLNHLSDGADVNRLQNI
jgi:type IV pilus assembly protein PilC